MEVFVTMIMNRFGYFGVFLLIFVENIFPPIPSEVILTFGGFSTTLENATMTIPGTIIAATCGSVAGALVLYYIGTFFTPEKLAVFIDRPLIRRLGFTHHELDMAVRFSRKHGNMAILFGRCVPIIRSLISIPAGMLNMPLAMFLLYTTIGSAIWNTLLVGFGAKLGENRQIIITFIDRYTVVVVVIGVALLIALLIHQYRKIKRT